MPPLRERKTDILLLADYFLEKYAKENHKDIRRFSTPAIDMLVEYHWPGNVRELENAIERAVVLSKSRTLDIEDFSFLQTSPSIPSEPMSLRQMERHYIQRILGKCDWNITKAAKILDINRVTLHKKIKRYDMRKNTE